MAVRKKVKLGDIFVFSDLTFNDQTYALSKKIRLGKIVFISKHTTWLIGIIPSCDTFAELPDNLDAIKFSNKIFYTDWYLLRDGTWEIIGNQEVTSDEEDLTLRRVGARLYHLDTDLGVVAKADLKKYPNQLIYGYAILYESIDKL